MLFVTKLCGLFVRLILLMSLINLWLERLERSMGGRKQTSQKKEQKKVSMRLQRDRMRRGDKHVGSKWCNGVKFLCNNPAHWKWMPRENANARGWGLTHYGGLRAYISMINPVDGLALIFQQAMLERDEVAFKALGILAFNNEEYADYKKLVAANYESILYDRKTETA